LYYILLNNVSRVRRYIVSGRQKWLEAFLAYFEDMELSFETLSYQVSESEKVNTMRDFKRYGRKIELMSMMHRTDRINVIDEVQNDEK
jgi:hypothetical protein